MQTTETDLRLCSSDGTVVLILEISVPTELSERADVFYKSIADAFECSVRERFHPMAQRAYDGCTDRRKRYRYTPWRAVLRVTPCEGGVTLFICANGDILRHERHLWSGDVLTKRIRIKDR